MLTDTVECHSGSVYAERPTAFTWQGRRFIVDEILSRGRTPQLKWFRVRTTDDLVFELSLIETDGNLTSELEWNIHQI
jgi:hypothetical protein